MQDLQLQTPPAKANALTQIFNSNSDVDAKDLALLEQRVTEMERYLGIEDMDLEYFYDQDGEDLCKKTQLLDDFMRIAVYKHFCMKELYTRYEKMESFLKHSEPFTQQCMELKHKSQFVIDQLEQLETFLKLLEQIKAREKYLSFDPIADPQDTLQELQQLKLTHNQQLLESENNAEQVDDLLQAYNEIVERLSEHMIYLHSQK